MVFQCAENHSTQLRDVRPLGSLPPSLPRRDQQGMVSGTIAASINARRFAPKWTAPDACEYIQPVKALDSFRHCAYARIVTIYTILSLAYIWWSDWIVLKLIHDPQILTQIQNFKGWAFVLGSAGLLFVLIRREERQRERAEEAIRLERDFSNAVLDSLPGVFYCYDEKLKFRRWNKNFEEVTGFTSTELVTKSPLDFFVGADKKLIQARVQDVFATGRADAEAEFVAKDGTSAPYYFTGVTTLIDQRRHLIGVGIDLSARKRAEAALQESRTQLRALTARLESLREEERIRISREIHDELGQKLTAVKMDLYWLENRLDQINDAKLRAALEEKVLIATTTTDETMVAVQRIAAELRPAMLDSLGLMATLRHEAKQFEARTGIPVKLTLPADHLKLDGAIATTVYRIFQEVLTNVMRHAHATQVTANLEIAAGKLHMEVADNGSGVAAPDLTAPESLGLLGMTERAAMLNGNVRIEGAPGQGTRVRLEIPIANSTAPVKQS
jgi:PAS domain S-box-containing protein